MPFHHCLHHTGSLGFVRVVQWSRERIHKEGYLCFLRFTPCLLWLLHKFHFLTAPVATTGRVSCMHTNPLFLYLLNWATPPPLHSCSLHWVNHHTTPVFVALKPTGEVIVPGLLFTGIISPWQNTWPRHSCTPITSSTTHQLRAAQRTAVTNSLSPWQNPCPIHLCAPITSSSELQTPPPGVLLFP